MILSTVKWQTLNSLSSIRKQKFLSSVKKCNLIVDGSHFSVSHGAFQAKYIFGLNYLSYYLLMKKNYLEYPC